MVFASLPTRRRGSAQVSRRMNKAGFGPQVFQAFVSDFRGYAPDRLGPPTVRS